MPITWIEWDGFEEGSRSRCHLRIVDFETASRNGEPFSRLNEALGILPNPVMHTCTANLKVKAGRAFMQSRGYGEWQNVMRIRADEPRSVTRLTSPGRGNSGGEPNLPLARADVRKADVLAFWRAQPFDLALDPEGDFGNCDGCFLKARHKIVRAFVTRPELATWSNNEKSRPSGATFRNDRPRYSELLREAEFYAKQIPLAFPEHEEDNALIDCMCGDCPTEDTTMTQSNSLADALTEEQRQALGEALTEYFATLDSDAGIRAQNGRILRTFDYCDSRNIDDLIDRAIAPALSASPVEQPAAAPDGAEPPRHIVDAAMEVARHQYRHGVTRASIIAIWEALGKPWYAVATSANETGAEGLDGLARELWAAAQLAPGDGIEDGVRRIAAIVSRYGDGADAHSTRREGA
ncbi:hypothetical protein WI80_25035 [Burkholderia ubonensis]|uniref:hypothetical protein n=1 Tax=Burkholderia ubonensis TaxID=101571 RepID=UPI00075726A2|nr:hypothetical protein [Burkholderia ubonensis]KVD24763.1 hypothetical protein WI80_25035 [Burkholderia ubonensis]KVU16814.1 hypothetical protein WK63_13550 [Burkholderia ubonensis]